MTMDRLVDGDVRELIDDFGIANDRSDRAVRLDDVLYTGNRGDRLEQLSQRGNIRVELRALLVEENILGRQHYRLGASGDLSPNVLENVVERQTPSFSKRDRTERTSASAPARDLDDTEDRTIVRRWDQFHRRALAFDLTRKRFAKNGGLK